MTPSSSKNRFFKSSAKRLVLVDGSGFIFRSFYAIGSMTSPDGTPVNAVFGFCSMVLKLQTQFPNDDIAFIFDTGSENFRHEIYPQYKANRSAAPEELIPQFSLIHEVVKAFGLPCISKEKFEADDLIASYTQAAKKQNVPVLIVSSDKDLMQLIDDDIYLFDAMKNKFIDDEQVKEKFGVLPHQMIDLQALTGDQSDNIPGVPGIGVKTAASLLNQFGTLHNLLENAHEIPQKKRRENLENHRDMALISEKLVRLRTDIPVELSQVMGENKLDENKLRNFFQRHNFQSLLKKFPFSQQQSPPQDGTPVPLTQPQKASFKSLHDLKELDQFISKAFALGVVAFDTQTDHLNPYKANLVGLSLCIEKDQAIYLPFSHCATQEDEKKNLPRKEVLLRLKPLFENPGIRLIAHNSAYDIPILNDHNIAPYRIDDTMVLSYVLNGSKHRHNLDHLSQIYLHHSPIEYEDVTGKGKDQILFPQVPLEKATPYAAEDAWICYQLYHHFSPQLIENKQSQIYETIDRPLIDILIKMKKQGIYIDCEILKNLSKDFEKIIDDLQNECHDLAGEKFNLASPKQLGHILFEKLGLPGGKKTKTKAWQTSIDILEDLKNQGHQLPEKLIHWRHLSKLKSTYTDALIEHIDPQTQRVHTSFSQTTTNTGRLSSANPNLQNIPIRTDEGRKIRRAFTSRPDHQLISADYSQIELRILAHMANVQALKQAFDANEDVHALTACRVFGCSINHMTPLMRHQAKAVNFGIIYGLSPFGLSRQLKISTQEAKFFIDAYFDHYPEIKNYMDQTIEKAHEKKYVTTLFGRRIYLQDHSSNSSKGVNSFFNRAAINGPIQGTCADLIKRAMIRIHQAMEKEKLNLHMLIQVHDELIFECHHDHISQACDLIEKTMNQAAEFSVKLETHVSVADNWGQAHS